MKKRHFFIVIFMVLLSVISYSQPIEFDLIRPSANYFYGVELSSIAFADVDDEIGSICFNSCAATGYNIYRTSFTSPGGNHALKSANTYYSTIPNSLGFNSILTINQN